MPINKTQINRELKDISNSKALCNEKLIELRNLYERDKSSFNESNTALFLRALAMTDKISESIDLQKDYQELAQGVVANSLSIPFRGSLLNMTTILKSCAKLGIQHEKLESLATSLLYKNLNAMSADECLQLGFSLLKLNITDTSIFYQLFISFKEKFAQSKAPLLLADILYIISCLFILNSGQSRDLKKEFNSFLKENLTENLNIPDNSLNNFWIFLTSLRSGFLPEIAPPAFLAYTISNEEFAAITTRTEENQENPPTSMLEKTWRERIKYYFSYLKIQQHVLKGAYELDLLINDRFNVEIDGVYHYVKQNDRYQLKASNIVRDKLLTAMGITTIRLPFFELDLLQQPDKIERYLQEKLKPLLLSLSPLAPYIDAQAFNPRATSTNTTSMQTSASFSSISSELSENLEDSLLIDTSEASTSRPSSSTNLSASMPTSSSFSSLSSDEKESPELRSMLIDSSAEKPTSNGPSIFLSSPKKPSTTDFRIVPGKKNPPSTLEAHSAQSPLRRFSFLNYSPATKNKVKEKKKHQDPVIAQKPDGIKKRSTSSMEKQKTQKEEEFDLDSLIEKVREERRNTPKNRSCCTNCIVL